ncbi:unnamed protein product [Ambrosiozyma monospora]|uniref:Unnamed protein product n=1 Tax=Ambrosiozyma monospora TaxID=43982 RepID=A0ACB5SUG6_AMBMO|nr:unnamed protein product [Ambrosiozyma monospora]
MPTPGSSSGTEVSSSTNNIKNKPSLSSTPGQNSTLMNNTTENETDDIRSNSDDDISVATSNLPNQYDIEKALSKQGTHSLSLVKTESRVAPNADMSKVLTNTDAISHRIQEQNDAGVPIPPMGADRDYPPMLPPNEDYVVAFDGENDPIHPHNWPMKQKVMICALLGYDTFCIAFGSSIFSACVPAISEIFGVANVVATLGISLYVFGFATGPLVWAPLSELYGRKPIILISSFMFTVFNFAVATSDRLESILICRFFAGCLGAAPMVCVPAAMSDMYGNKTRGTVIVLFSMAVIVGPMVAPFVGAFIVVNKSLGWRWCSFMVGIISSPQLVLIPFFFKETHHPIILVEKAEEIKRRTGNWGIHAAHDEFKLTFKEVVENNLNRPLKMLLTEPILLVVSIYNAFVYGMMYLFLTAYPLVFQYGYRMKPGVAELPFLGLAIGMMLGGLLCIYAERDFNKKLTANNGVLVPENRLPIMIFGAVAFPVGILWFCWTGNYPEHVHWAAPCVSGIMTGFGVMVIFIPSMNYIIDSYLLFAASAIAGLTFLRSGFGGAFPLFAEFMFVNMHVNWAGLLLGVFGLVLVLFPIIFIKFGKRLRQKSKYAFDLSGK